MNPKCIPVMVGAVVALVPILMERWDMRRWRAQRPAPVPASAEPRPLYDEYQVPDYADLRAHRDAARRRRR